MCANCRCRPRCASVHKPRANDLSTRYHILQVPGFVNSNVDVYRQKKRSRKYLAWKELLILCPATNVMLTLFTAQDLHVLVCQLAWLRQVAHRLGMLCEVAHRLISEPIDAQESQYGRSEFGTPVVAK
jgi:hypothetical protein